jgi:predicted murein hydrolase (TIGR00659 family)
MSITIIIYIFALQLYKKSKLAILNPVLLTILAMVAGLLIFRIPYEEYENHTSFITYMLSPIIIFLAVPIYKNRDKIGENLLPIAIGIFSGILTSIVSVYVLGKLFHLDEKIMESIYAKSITTPLALEVTKMVDGIEGVTIVAVLITGVCGATMAPFVMKIGKVKNEIAKGVGIGASSHGVGTSKAVEMSTEAGGASGLAMAITGVITVVIASIALNL